MPRGLSLVVLLSLISPGMAAERIALNGHHFTLPDGFTVEMAAAPPQVLRPITASLDEQGRLYVADSSGSNEPVATQLEKKPHRILRLEDTNGDGRFDRSTVFADQMMFPEGTLWYQGSLYVAAPPSIWKLTDTNGDGVADKREEWFAGKTLTGCANDLHGPYLGPDGWIYWCKGAFAKQSYTLANGKAFTTRASHIFRCRPDGSGFEPVMTGGMDNPVDVAFTPTGERIFTTTFFQHPAGGQRDGLIHAIYGGIYGKDHDPIDEHPWTSPTLMPVLTHLGPAAPAGLHALESSQWGADYAGNLFAAQFNLRRVSRHQLRANGGMLQSMDSDFLVSDHIDFHPTDVLEDADGSLLVVDTGGWYKLCCPTSQFIKPDVVGAIYRIRRKGTMPPRDPLGKSLDWQAPTLPELARRLSDARPMVRRRAMEQLATAGAAAIPSLEMADPLAAIWTAARIETPAARALVRRQLSHDREDVRLAALQVVSLHRDAEARDTLQSLLASPSPMIRRLSAECLGRIGNPAAIPFLLTAIANPANDRIVDHAMTYALIEIGSPDPLQSGRNHPSARVRRAVLTALDQMPGGKLSADAIAAALLSDDATLRETARWIAGRHPEMGTALAVQFRPRLQQIRTPEDSRDWVTLLAQLAGNDAISALLVERVTAGDRLALQAMRAARLKQSPPAWYSALAKRLPGADATLAAEILDTARSMSHASPPVDWLDALAQLAHATDRAELLRLQALALLPASRFVGGDFAWVLPRVHRDQPVAVRATAAEVLARMPLTTEQRLELASRLPQTTPMELNKLMDLYANSANVPVGLAFLEAVDRPEMRAIMRKETLTPRFEKSPPAVQTRLKPLLAALDAAQAESRQKLEQLARDLPMGDIRRGQAVFHGTKVACVACHKVGYVGGQVGPDMTRIGSIRSERDLLEAIVLPSASFVRSYEPVQVTTVDGRLISGILKKDGLDEVILTLNAVDEIRIPRGDIEEITPGQVSVMPSGLDQQLSKQELADLIAFLRACR
ncbi:PVC-type heme-binding CxxCH protein [Tuwongella immobilis]|uniref:Cytochrome c domain-containing protein n=1 Tax=Tuwongella immobilis TaxID=692036 RepID=A0A6C2YX60_9BACT|nr:PVC-type heme-binding CxxCH protein [Tuwongella immobilis]VIP05479.1 heme-binding protein : Putative membrane-bound dehydrogenase OS=Singulisphaera acidiphila (strain ATCC BAA-1392 / DSM 18658 / VKM B-2454 / MOB10) GN=Sinac_7042 PE=4 SV=1: HEAT_2: Cytochrom_C [Tuwongella immobilis]VTS08314.1 heme-binding protein : Putative membrane-bound dehydrogenase OS=Singulisphaera acidiphila (strain ATCC BAA-1392 / DSM 18658 / VKM B-2454 / MOB10) GN=Sinac_7042 PE=4 SV=1: HEAT_2: Cytochrom_C [Tuwongella im